MIIKKIDNILMKSRMYVMYVTKIRKERFQVYPTIIKVMGSTRYTRFPPRLTIGALRCTLHKKYRDSK